MPAFPTYILSYSLAENLSFDTCDLFQGMWSAVTSCLRELWGFLLLKTSNTLDTNIVRIFIKGEVLLQVFDLCYTATTLDLQTCLHTCFDTCVILLYSSSVSLEERPFRLLPFLWIKVIHFVVHILELKNILYLHDNQQMPIYKYVESHTIIVQRHM